MKKVTFVLVVILVTLACSVQAQRASLKAAAGGTLQGRSLQVIPNFRMVLPLEVAVEVDVESRGSTSISSRDLEDWLFSEATGMLTYFGMPRNVFVVDKEKTPVRGAGLLLLKAIVVGGVDRSSSSDRNRSSADYNNRNRAGISTTSSSSSQGSRGSYFVAVSGVLKVSTNGRSYNRTVGSFEEPVAISSEEVLSRFSRENSSISVRGSVRPNDGRFNRRSGSSGGFRKDRQVQEAMNQTSMLRTAGSKIAAQTLKAIQRWQQIKTANANNRAGAPR